MKRSRNDNEIVTNTYANYKFLNLFLYEKKKSQKLPIFQVLSSEYSLKHSRSVGLLS